MSAFLVSYRRVVLSALVLTLGAMAGVSASFLILHGSVAGVLAGVFTIGAVAAASLLTSGLIVVARVQRLERHAADLFLALNSTRGSGSSVPAQPPPRALRRFLCRIFLGHDLLVGDKVEIRPLAEILRTLDEKGNLAGMPFMAEMARYCGQRAHVFRSVDKIYDFGLTRRMRRLDGWVSLGGLRCDGADHGGCQARCYLLWNTRWLRRIGASSDQAPVGSAPAVTSTGVAGAGAAQDATRYRCQFTQLHAASRPMSKHGVLKELRPLVAGNVTLAAFGVALATRWFNLVQLVRRGQGFPPMPSPRPPAAPACPPPPLVAGDRVIVKSGPQIAATLNAKNKNLGLWFDVEMLRYCGQTCRVLYRVDRIIDSATGQLRTMKAPCIVLDGVEATGEFQNFGPQQEYVYWREVWLEKAQAPDHRPA